MLDMTGKVAEGQRITTLASARDFQHVDARTDFSVQEIGLLTPEPLRTGSLQTGQVGYLISGTNCIALLRYVSSSLGMRWP